MKTYIPQDQNRSFRKGFTLIELLVVIVIVAALAAVTFTMTTRIRRNADEALTLSNMRQIGTMLLSSVSDKGRFPDRMGGATDPTDSPRWDRAIISGLGYTGDTAGPINRTTALELEGLARIFFSHLDPSAKLADKNSYKKSFGIPIWTCNANGAPFNGLPKDKGVPFSVLKRPGNCAMLCQLHVLTNIVGGVGDLTHQGKPAEDFKKNGQLICFADGHIRKVPHNLSDDEFREQHEPGDRKNKVGN